MTRKEWIKNRRRRGRSFDFDTIVSAILMTSFVLLFTFWGLIF